MTQTYVTFELGGIVTSKSAALYVCGTGREFASQRDWGVRDCDVALMPNARYRRIMNMKNHGAQT